MKLPTKFLIIFIFTLFPFSSLLAQDRITDSLENVLLTSNTKDTIRVNNLDRLSYRYYRKDLKKAKEYNQRAEALSIELNFEKGRANAIYVKGIIEMVQSNFDLAIKHFENAAEIYTTNNIQKNIAGCYNGIGVIYHYQSNYDLSTSYYEKAINADRKAGIERRIPNYLTNIASNFLKTGSHDEALTTYKRCLISYTSNKDTLGISSCLRNIASVYQNQGNYQLALENHNDALILAEKIQDSAGISNSLNNMSIVYKSQKNYDKALEMLEKALLIRRNMKDEKSMAAIKNNIGQIYNQKEENTHAITYLQEALAINRKINSKSQTAESLNGLAFAYVSLKKYAQAYDYYNEAKNINIEIGNREGISYCNLGIAEINILQQKYDQALVNILNAKKIADNLKLTDHQRDVHRMLSDIYSSKGLYKKAFENYKKYKALNDTLFNKDNIQKMTALEYEYKFRQERDSLKINELQLKETVKTTTKDLEKSQQNLLYGVIIFLAAALLMGSIIFFLKLRNEKAKTQNAIVAQKLLRSQMTPHFIFNSLSVLQGMILNNEEKNSVTYLSKFSKLLRTILENSRYKTVLLSEELAAIDDYVALQNLDETPPYQYTLTISPEIDVAALKIPPMLIQPFIENAIEHAFPYKKEDKKITIHLSFENENLQCIIEDNGIGIAMKNQPTKKNAHKNSLATTITSERLKTLSKDLKKEGSITIENKKTFGEEGTLVTLIIPYVSEEIEPMRISLPEKEIHNS